MLYEQNQNIWGKKDRKSIHDLHASILEIRDEGNIKNLSHKNNVYLDKKQDIIINY